MNKYNAPEVLAALFRALEAAGLGDTVQRLRQMGVPRLINEAWQHRDQTLHVGSLARNWGPVIYRGSR